MVRVSTRILADARTAGDLGTKHEGSGVVINADGLVLTIGYLMLEAESAEIILPGGWHFATRPIPGNMFVPINLLKLILGDLLARGRKKGGGQPWLGLTSEEVRGRLFVTRVRPGGSAAAAGIEPGDLILDVGGKPVTSLADF